MILDSLDVARASLPVNSNSLDVARGSLPANSLFALIEEGAARVSPDKPAVFAGARSITYRELLDGARGIATTLQAYGVGKGDRVGVWMDKTPSCVQSLLGVLAAGAAYVPLDPRAPWRRCQAIATDCGLAAIIADKPRLANLASFLEGLAPRVVLIEGEREAAAAAIAEAGNHPFEILSDAAGRPPGILPDVTAQDIAYILYTSGSTGTPKGVIHTHASALAFTRWVQTRFEIVPEDVFSSHAPFHFDLSISDLYASLGTGAALRLISSTEGMLAPYLVKMIPEWGITVWYSVPSILVAMLDAGDVENKGLPSLRLLFFAGEVFPTPQLRRLRRALPGLPFYNLFGPTETNVCTYYEVPADIPDEQTAPISIGRACEHMECFVIDDDGETVGAGVEGTLWAKGGNLMSGYWNDPERTGTTLRDDPRKTGTTAGKSYCTGDRVKLQTDGNYEFLGRRDHMVKTRGYRVELGEIESILAGHPGVLEAVALPIPDPAIGNEIVVSVVPRQGETLDPAALRAYCQQYLPTYMIPARAEVRASLPRTSTGKADRTALILEWESEKSA